METRSQTKVVPKQIYCKDCETITCEVPWAPKDRCPLCNGSNIEEEIRGKNPFVLLGYSN